MAAAFLFAVLYEALAGCRLAVHFAWILWVILGALVTRGRPLAAGFHILSLIYTIVIEVAPWPCPLTLAEDWLRGKAGMTSCADSFLMHYLEALVDPDVSQRLTTAATSGPNPPAQSRSELLDSVAISTR
jgi:hypothetical protein